MLHPGWLFAIGLVVLLAVTWRLRWPLPVGLLFVSLLVALLAGFLTPFRHLVEGGFGYLNLVLALFAGAFFGQAMRQSGAADAVGAALVRVLGARVPPVLLVAGTLLFLVGMFVGIAGVAVLATGVFVVPMLRAIGMSGQRIGAFIAVVATCGMIAPPVNVPAMTIADGVNMPYAAFETPLLVLALIPALFTLVLFSFGNARIESPAPAPDVAPSRASAVAGFLALAVVLGFWTLLRIFPLVIPDPAIPIVLVIGGLAALPLLSRSALQTTFRGTFAGTPLTLAAVLVTVGVAVQVMTLTGIRGWLVINSMSFPPPWTYVEMIVMPIFGGALTSIGAANVLGVPFAFALIHQDMILNVSGLSAIAALAEFMPPTAIAAALATYIVGDATLWQVIRRSLWPVLVLAAVAMSMLVFAEHLTGILGTTGAAVRNH